ncbi:MAG: F0F1 ATP synthase subunit A [Firmicutes bacterium]|nr:F0F1 ATP synthase subunit A [Bacillota bacterium]
MHSLDHLGPKKIFGFLDGQVYVTETVLNAWIVTIVLIIIALLLTRKMEKVPKGPQVIAELIVGTVYNMVNNTMGPKGEKYAPYIGTIFFFLLGCNALGLFGLRPVTSDVNATLSVALITFGIVQISAFRSRGPAGYFKHFAAPMPFMVPIKILEEVVFPISLCLRLFGNILAGAIIMALVMTALEGASLSMGSSVPFLQIFIPLIPNMFFDVFEPVLHAYIFCILTMVFTKNGMAHDH